MRVVFVGRQRQLWRIALLYLVTLGIARRVWLYRINKEVDGHAALALNHTPTVVLLCLPIIGPGIVTAQTAYRLNTYLETDLDLKYGPTWALSLTSLVPILGPLFFQLWTQDRLNKYWLHERDNPAHAIDITQGLEKDKEFQRRVSAAREASRRAGSRQDGAWERTKRRIAGSGATYAAIKEERQRVRAAGGSTPVLPWRRPERPPHHRLHVTCGDCEFQFEAEQDPFAETPLVCPRCGMQEVLPSLRGDPLRSRGEHVNTATLKIDCPKCDTTFHTVRNLHGPTKLSCFNCGKTGSVPAPKVQKPKAA